MQALMSLMATRGYRRITTDVLLDRARVARSTFYAHFHGKDDLLRENIEYLRTLAVTKHVDLPPEQRLLRFSRAFYEHAQANRQLYLSLLRDPDRGAAVFRKMQAILSDVAADELREASSQDDPKSIEHAVQFFVGAQWSVLVWWLERKPELDADVVHARFERLAMAVLTALRGQ